MRVGAVDIGSNSVRMLVAEFLTRPDGSEEAVTIARAGESCRLARGMERSGQVDAEMSERAASLSSEFVHRARSLGAAHIVIGATAALRVAANGAAVADLIAARAGVAVRILSGEDEARLVYRSVVGGLGARVRAHSCLAFDIGGGSTEVVSGVGDRPGRWVSLPFGAVSLTDRHLKTDPPPPEEIAGLRAEVAGAIMHKCAYMPDRAPVFVGVGGTVTVLASLDRGITAYDPALLEGWQISADRLQERISQIVHSSHVERATWPVMGEGRADIVVAGALILDELARRFPSPGLLCSTQGLRYGLARMAFEELRDRGQSQTIK